MLQIELRFDMLHFIFKQFFEEIFELIYILLFSITSGQTKMDLAINSIPFPKNHLIQHGKMLH